MYVYLLVLVMQILLNSINIRSFPDIYMICIDVANGYSERFVSMLNKFRQTFPNKVLIAGNVVTSEMTEQLILAGAILLKLVLVQVRFVLHESKQVLDFTISPF